MKILIAILFLIPALAIGASNPSTNSTAETDKLKWLKAGFEVAFHDFPDEELAYIKIHNFCGGSNWQEFVADVEIGQNPYLVPSGYKTQIYYTDIGKDFLVFKCKK